MKTRVRAAPAGIQVIRLAAADVVGFIVNLKSAWGFSVFRIDFADLPRFRFGVRGGFQSGEDAVDVVFVDLRFDFVTADQLIWPMRVPQGSVSQHGVEQAGTPSISA